MKSRENEKLWKCCICGKWFKGWGNNPSPVKEKGQCCDMCNMTTVIPARINALHNQKNVVE